MLGNFTCRQSAAGQVAAKMGMEHAIKTAQQNGVAVVGIAGWVTAAQSSYFVQQAARAGFIGISMCQSNPMVVPFGGAKLLRY
ncbi:Ldh family oxidoreductase [Escherichia coli]